MRHTTSRGTAGLYPWILLVALGALTLVGCGGNPTGTESQDKASPTAIAGPGGLNSSAKRTASAMPPSARAQNLALGLASDEEYSIVDPATEFKPNAQEIVLSVEVRNVTKPTAIGFKWIYVPTGESVDVPDQTIVEDRRMTSSLARGADPFPNGEYRAVVLIDGKEAASIGYTIKP